MADATEDDVEEDAPKRKLSGKKIVLFVGAPLLVLALILLVVFFLFMGGEDEAAMDEGMEGADEEMMEEAATPPPLDGPALDEDGNPVGPTYYDVPSITVNLMTNSRRPSFMQMDVVVELAQAEDLEMITLYEPKIIDSFQVFVRELRAEDLEGAEGQFRLREELLRRVNAAISPMRAKDVLFRRFIVQ